MKTPRFTDAARTQGFTLIELLVVISIIAILAGFALPVFTSAQKKGRITDSLSNVKQVNLALRMYAGDNDGTFPNTTVPVGAAPGTDLKGKSSNEAFENLMPKYTTTKKIFQNKNSAWCSAAKVGVQSAATANLIQTGENDLIYILGLSDTSDARYPLIATGTQKGTPTYTLATTAKGGVWAGTDAVIGFCDGSAKAVGGKDMNTVVPTATFPKSPEDGTSNIFITSTTWMDGTSILDPL